MLLQIGILKNFAIFTGKRLCWSIFLIKFIKKRLQHGCLSLNVTKVLRAAKVLEHLRWLFLEAEEENMNVIKSVHCTRKTSFFVQRIHCVKNVPIQSFFWSVFSCIWTRKTPYLDIFHPVILSGTHFIFRAKQAQSNFFLQNTHQSSC